MTHFERMDGPLEAAQEAPAEHGWMAKLPALLRSLGALAVIASLYGFLVRGWEGSDDLIRYLMLLGHTGLLAALGLASGHFLREGKGARLLMTLGLVSVPVNFAILGAFILSSSGGAIGGIPDYVTWTAPGAFQTGLVLAGAAAVLVPVILLGFTALARGMNKSMTGLFLLGNAVMLLPVRDAGTTAALALALGMLVLAVTTMLARRRTEAKTREGMLALLLQFVPIGVLLGRTLWLYHADMLLFSATSLLVFVALRQLACFDKPNSLLRPLIEFVSVPWALAAGTCLHAELTGLGVAPAGTLIAATLVSSGLLAELSARASRGRGHYRILAGVLAASGMLYSLMVFGGPLAALTTLAVGLVMIGASYGARQVSLLVIGLILTGAGLVHQVSHFFQAFNLGYWAGMAAIGITTIIAASVLEARGARIRQALSRWRAGYADWQY